MNGSDPLPAPPTTSQAAAVMPEISRVQRELQHLRTLLIASLMALIILSFSLDIYVFRQVSLVRKELDSSNSLLNDYQARREPLINSFVSGLQEYSRNHPDFTPILERYGVSPSMTSPSATSVTPGTKSK